jgi:hypothetical protein
MRTTDITLPARRWLGAAAVIVDVTVLVGRSGTVLAQVPPGAEADHFNPRSIFMASRHHRSWRQKQRCYNSSRLLPEQLVMLRTMR